MRIYQVHQLLHTSTFIFIPAEKFNASLFCVRIRKAAMVKIRNYFNWFHSQCQPLMDHLDLDHQEADE